MHPQTGSMSWGFGGIIIPLNYTPPFPHSVVHPSVLISFKLELQERACLGVKIIPDCRHCSCSGKVTNGLVPQNFGLQCP